MALGSRDERRASARIAASQLSMEHGLSVRDVKDGKHTYHSLLVSFDTSGIVGLVKILPSKNSII